SARRPLDLTTRAPTDVSIVSYDDDDDEEDADEDTLIGENDYHSEVYNTGLGETINNIRDAQVIITDEVERDGAVESGDLEILGNEEGRTSQGQRNRCLGPSISRHFASVLATHPAALSRLEGLVQLASQVLTSAYFFNPPRDLDNMLFPPILPASRQEATTAPLFSSSSTSTATSVELTGNNSEHSISTTAGGLLRFRDFDGSLRNNEELEGQILQALIFRPQSSVFPISNAQGSLEASINPPIDGFEWVIRTSIPTSLPSQNPAISVVPPSPTSTSTVTTTTTGRQGIENNHSNSIGNTVISTIGETRGSRRRASPSAPFASISLLSSPLGDTSISSSPTTTVPNSSSLFTPPFGTPFLCLSSAGNDSESTGLLNVFPQVMSSSASEPSTASLASRFVWDIGDPESPCGGNSSVELSQTPLSTLSDTLAPPSTPLILSPRVGLGTSTSQLRSSTDSALAQKRRHSQLISQQSSDAFVVISSDSNGEINTTDTSEEEQADHAVGDDVTRKSVLTNSNAISSHILPISYYSSTSSVYSSSCSSSASSLPSMPKRRLLSRRHRSQQSCSRLEPVNSIVSKSQTSRHLVDLTIENNEHTDDDDTELLQDIYSLLADISTTPQLEGVQSTLGLDCSSAAVGQEDQDVGCQLIDKLELPEGEPMEIDSEEINPASNPANLQTPSDLNAPNSLTSRHFSMVASTSQQMPERNRTSSYHQNNRCLSSRDANHNRSSNLCQHHNNGSDFPKATYHTKRSRHLSPAHRSTTEGKRPRVSHLEQKCHQHSEGSRLLHSASSGFVCSPCICRIGNEEGDNNLDETERHHDVGRSHLNSQRSDRSRRRPALALTSNNGSPIISKSLRPNDSDSGSRQQ
ncbi:unnamed protein product, partial [Protopolystoma xenopodis]